jgi:hypothetical protein
MNGLLVRRYPTSISDDGLERLRRFSEARVSRRAPTFAAWLTDVLHVEQARRLRFERGDLREPSAPEIPAVDWTDAEVGAALREIYALLAAIKDQAALDFLRAISFRLVAIATRRLECRH